MGIRVIKTATAGLAAIYTAHYFGLEPFLSAGLLAILGVEVTRMKGLKAAFARFMASVVGLFFASLIFTLFGFELWSVSIFILIAFPILARLQLQGGIVTSSVIVFHLFSAGEVTQALIVNEILLLVTGLGWASIFNLLYMPREEGRLHQQRRETERLFGEIFTHLAQTLRDPAHMWNGEQLLAAEASIQAGLRRAQIYRENTLWRYESYWRTYFEMRSSQLESIQQMLGLVALVYEKMPQGILLAEVFGHLAEEVKSDVYIGRVERELERLEERFREMPLPLTRDEFELRASLYQLCHELERYLSIAKRWKKRDETA
ncbi:aromatic acid exporter family protein [Paenibacillus sp. IB182496]|uniref:Aromatic acid exporter family protein n=1 Tax=Paenibacillus sabuli TaxID=2772509 RepID=A0A927GTZ9_9BACL|nr:aromatic acid exporter family protein [Paenibacillus sabuli]MBD2847620.1 aromatic acid exporter family protein [Paenibacillus sabuli]